jgi:hypothetical protein
VRKYGIAPPAFRYKLWRVQSLLLRELCSELGIEFVPASAEVQDPQGMLAKSFWVGDATHANASFGKMVLDAVAERFGVPQDRAGVRAAASLNAESDLLSRA